MDDNDNDNEKEKRKKKNGVCVICIVGRHKRVDRIGGVGRVGT